MNIHTGCTYNVKTDPHNAILYPTWATIFSPLWHRLLGHRCLSFVVASTASQTALVRLITTSTNLAVVCGKSSFYPARRSFSGFVRRQSLGDTTDRRPDMEIMPWRNKTRQELRFLPAANARFIVFFYYVARYKTPFTERVIYVAYYCRHFKVSPAAITVSIAYFPVFFRVLSG